MLRLLGYIGAVFVTMLLLRALPVVGGLFRVPLFGFFLAAAVVGFVAERVGRAMIQRRRSQRARRELGAVDTPHNRGKLGSLLLSEGRPSQAIGPLRAAVAGEPDTAEWHYRLGCALLATRKPREAAEALERSVALDPEHAYGSALLRLAEARQAEGEPARSLEAIERFEATHGPTPESAYRRGLAHKALGQKDSARDSFDQVARAARHVARYQRGEARSWVVRATLARMLG